ncbi:Plasmid stabilization system [mine drainage metagenome]|uniref:Plasmid stabilization system n=1 Tax=mine drainage metagenome TaxID=410659 RepID=T1BEH3_9ZZZZ
MKRIRLSDLARDDLDEIWFLIAIENLPPADRLVDKVQELLQKLLEFPEMGIERDDIRTGVRRFPCGNYLVFYRPMPDGIAVLRIVYGGRDLETIEYPLQ